MKSVFTFFENDPPITHVRINENKLNEYDPNWRSKNIPIPIQKLISFYKKPPSLKVLLNLHSKAKEHNKTFKLKNFQAFDLGFDELNTLHSFGAEKFYDNETDFLNIIDEKFDVILVADRLEDSLAYLSLKFPMWEESDFCVGAFYSQKFEDFDRADGDGHAVNSSDGSPSFGANLDNLILKWNHIDTALYKLAINRLDNFIKNFGEKNFSQQKSLISATCQRHLKPCESVPEYEHPRKNLSYFYHEILSNSNREPTFCEGLAFTPKMWRAMFKVKVYKDYYGMNLKNIVDAEGSSHKCANCDLKWVKKSFF